MGKSGDLPVNIREAEEGGREKGAGFLSPTAKDHLARAVGMRKRGETPQGSAVELTRHDVRYSLDNSHNGF